MQADGAVPLDFALLLEEKQLVEVTVRIDQTDVAGRHHPAVERGRPVEPAMRTHVVLGLDPGPQPAIEGVQAPGVGLGERREQLHAYRPKPAFLLPLAFWLGRPRRGPRGPRPVA